MSFKFSQILARPSFKGFLLQELVKASSDIQTINKLPNLRSRGVPLASSPIQDLSLSLAAFNITSIQTPSYIDPTRTKIPTPLPVPCVIQLPQSKSNITYEDQTTVKNIEEPNPLANLEKQAARLIVIRRKKMKKHKLRKLRKRMKFEWAKIKQKRELKKEKLFQAGLVEKIKLAIAFDAAKYASEKIAKAKEVELPDHWYGVRYPEHIIKQLMEEKEQKEKQKADDEKRRASMSPWVKDYLKDLPK